MSELTEDRLRELAGICEAADDQDTGSLDEFREAFDVGTCAELVDEVLALRDLTDRGWTDERR